jgi:tetratricopeptide (TPR) repeat protein
VCAGVLLATLGALTYRQARAYRDLETLCRDTIAKNPAAWNSYVNLSLHLIDAGRELEAVEVAREGLRVRPDVAELHSSLAGALWHAGERSGRLPDRLDEVIEHFQRAIELRPDYPENLENLATALSAANRHEEATVVRRRSLEARERAAPAEGALE